MNATPSFVLPLTQIRASDLPIAGGKGANLGELASLGLPVPPGFCVTTAVFRRFMAACPDAEALYTRLDALTPDDLEAVRRVGTEVRQALLRTPIPAEVATAVREARQAVGPDHAYAVRSSATVEDLPGASFAGQQETYLNVRGEEALLDAVHRCWVSLFTDRAILYRLQNGFSHRQVALAVVVQRMVPAEKSGILFTADPVTGHRHTAVIDAGFGLGEALVSGLVTPDTYRVDKRTRTSVERRIAAKTLAILPRPEGSTQQVVLPPEQQQQPVLSEAQVLALTDLGGRIEAHYGQPQDIEWAIAKGQILILQARPITSLYPIEGLESPDGSLRVYFSSGHQQNMTRAMAPLSLSSFRALLPLGDRFHNPFLRTAGGRLFLDITGLLRHPILRRPLFGLLSQLDAQAPEAARMVMQRPKFRRARPLRLPPVAIGFLLRMLLRIQRALWLEDLTGFVERTNARLDAFVDQARRRLEHAPPGNPRLEAILDFMADLFPCFLHWIPQWIAGEIARHLLTRLGRRRLIPDEAEALTLALPGNAVTEMNLAVGDLTDLARRSPQLVAWFQHLGEVDAHTWLGQAAQLPGSELFFQAWKAFLDIYGARGPAEIDIMMPRWYEDPLPLLQVIAAHLQSEPGSHRARQQSLAQAREVALAKLLRQVGRGPLGFFPRRLIRRWEHVLLNAGGLREHHKFLAIRVLREVKEVLKATAADLAAQSKLARPDDIWFLTWEELLGLWNRDLPDLAERIARRRADLERFQRLTPSLIITSDGETPVVPYRVEDAPPGALLGNPVSSGVAEGSAHIIHDPQRETLAPGEILVATFSDPGWTPLFINAAGLVLEVGGSLTHGAVVAREYGIPAVVGVRDATRRLRTGQRIRVDGNRGIIEILDH